MLTVNPWSGTAEIRHTRPPPKRTVAFPPCEGTVCTPEPGPAHPVSPPPVSDGRGAGLDAGARVGVGSGAASAVRDGDGLGLRVLGDALGEGAALRGGADRVAAGSSSGADWATGAVGRVESTTKEMVTMTAVTLAAVQDSHISR
ncbi:hypothetical protein [Streptomyces sp. bgisy022]|uniref:hypothetical protein n=1 Tax=Streptomyces sp. bgisy022 TaxID=3413769 RepID=UPI003D758BC1